MKVTEEMKQTIEKLKEKGLSNAKIGKILTISASTVAYHSSEDEKIKQKARAIKNQKPRERKDYQKKYQSNRYKNDPEYRERIKKDNRENQKKKYWEKKE